MTDPLGFIGSTGQARPLNPLGPIDPAAKPGAAPAAGSTPAFKDLLLDELREANRLQQEATRAVEDLQTGARTDFDAVILATRKADAAFQMIQQVRNKVIDAYNEVKQIRV